ncbi:MAG: hypothetical protein ACUZ8I_07845 [Candidatus Scalindua sp.]
MSIWAILESLRHFIPQDKLTLILFTDNSFSDPLLVEQGKEEVEFFGLVTSVMVYLGLRPKWGVWFAPCFGLF